MEQPTPPARSTNHPRTDLSGIPADELRAALATRKELGSEFESEVVDSFVERVSETIDARVDARVEARLAEGGERHEQNGNLPPTHMALASMGIAIPLTGAAGYTAGIPGVLAVWVGIVLINMAAAVSSRRSSRR